ncbi:type 4a pilus biogenesis protein PilO [Actinoplanes sp. NPDC051494]|uniref:type 4a pilus biogenesis protein PilO n=1 Tax=Actinoplanes sp. NPDC051494 TaxID=3363907 RepID=UPI0037AF5300
MGARHADRLWMLGGVIAIAVMSVIAYFLLISPQYAEADGLRAQTDDARSQASTIRSRIVGLKKDKANLKKLKATLATYQDALPSDSGVPAFLRQLQAAGTDIGVSVGGITVGAPAGTAATGVKQLPIQLTVTGSPEELNEFLEQLQGGGQKRAVLIETASWAAGETDQELSVVLQLNAFVAPPAAANAPAVTTD